ncbi:hypothetical protein T492DRAFT_19701 [Pavlovales sp. CCMP2436]|nr:hypothetical protein T492DRAFT_19701 [Pavlovales sp. CCMP2436]
MLGRARPRSIPLPDHEQHPGALEQHPGAPARRIPPGVCRVCVPGSRAPNRGPRVRAVPGSQERASGTRVRKLGTCVPGSRVRSVPGSCVPSHGGATRLGRDLRRGRAERAARGDEPGVIILPPPPFQCRYHESHLSQRLSRLRVC